MNYDTSFLDNEAEFDHGVKTVWQFARMRIAAGLKKPAVRLEIGVVLAALVVLFALPFLTWWREWRQPNSLQNYAEWIPLLVLGLLWVHRCRYVLPELDDLNNRFTERSVIRFLLEHEPEPPKRLRWLIVVAALLTPFALRLAEPAFTCFAFVLLLLGIMGYRVGTAALRLLIVPFTLLLLMIPLPGLVLDGINTRLNVIFFKVTLHLLQIFGFNAELRVEDNPLLLGSAGKSYIGVYIGNIGSGLAEAGVFLLLVVCWLTLYNAEFRIKLVALFLGLCWVLLLVVARMFLLASLVHITDEDVYAALLPLTRWAIPVLGLCGQFLILRGLKCREFQEWVSVSPR